MDYNGRADTVTLAKSYLTLPHTRVDVSGALGQRIQIRAVSRDLADFRPLAGDLPVKFNAGGAATVTATASGKLSAPRIAGDVLVTNFSAEGRPFTRLATNFDASKTGASVSNGVLARGTLQANFAAAVGLRDWKPENTAPLRADVTVRNADVQDVLALAGQSTSVPVTGQLTADAHISGTIGDPLGNADISVVNGTVQGERFDSLTAHAVMTQGSIDVPSLAFVAGPSRIDASAGYRHAPNDLQHGSFRVHVASNQVQLAQFQSLVKTRPGLRGALTLNADATGQVAARCATDCAERQRGRTWIGDGRQTAGRPDGHGLDGGTGRPVQSELRFRRLHDSRERPLSADRQARHHGQCADRQLAHRPRTRCHGAG